MDQSKRWLKDNRVRWENFVKGKEMEKEIRQMSTEFRVMSEDGVQVQGLAAVFNSLSENLGGFREVIEPGAFDGVLENDVRALKNHNPDWVLGRTKAGTLEIGVNDQGLWYRYRDPDTSYSRDLLKSLERGDVDQSSFAFTVDEDKWEEDTEGRYIRRIKRFRQLFDVSPVTYPAYPDTTAAKRELSDIESKKAELEAEKERKAQAEKEAAEREAYLRDLDLQG